MMRGASLAGGIQEFCNLKKIHWHKAVSLSSHCSSNDRTSTRTATASRIRASTLWSHTWLCSSARPRRRSQAYVYAYAHAYAHASSSRWVCQPNPHTKASAAIHGSLAFQSEELAIMLNQNDVMRQVMSKVIFLFTMTLKEMCQGFEHGYTKHC